MMPIQSSNYVINGLIFRKVICGKIKQFFFRNMLQKNATTEYSSKLLSDCLNILYLVNLIGLHLLLTSNKTLSKS